jgi:predicted PurR-regulated permease PerM
MNTTRHTRDSERRFLYTRRLGYGLLAITLFIYGMITIRNFLYPIAFGFLLAYLLYPVVNWLEMKRVPRILANMVTIIGCLALLAGLILVVYLSISPIIRDLSKLLDTGMTNFSELLATLGSYFGFERDKIQDILQQQASGMIETGSQYFEALFNATANTIFALAIMPVYIFLFLYYRTKFMYFLLKVAGKRHKRQMVAILREISMVTVRYMAGILVVVFILSIINSLGLWIIGFRYAIALGVASALFNLIPYFGTLIGGLVPLMFALLVEGDAGMVLRVVILFIIIQFIENNILTPNIVGGKVKINPFFIITGLIAGSMIWGIPGMLLVVPLLAIVRIVFAHIEFMKPYAYLLGEEGTRKHSFNFSRIGNLWKAVTKK